MGEIYHKGFMFHIRHNDDHMMVLPKAVSHIHDIILATETFKIRNIIKMTHCIYMF